MFLLWATWAHEYMAIFFKQLTGIARQDALKELDACDFYKTWSAYQSDDGICCEQCSEFLVVTFSYKQTKH